MLYATSDGVTIVRLYFQRVPLDALKCVKKAAQSHFNEFCQVIGHRTPTEQDPQGSEFTFEKRVTKADDHPCVKIGTKKADRDTGPTGSQKFAMLSE